MNMILRAGVLAAALALPASANATDFYVDHHAEVHDDDLAAAAGDPYAYGRGDEFGGYGSGAVELYDEDDAYMDDRDQVVVIDPDTGDAIDVIE